MEGGTEHERPGPNFGGNYYLVQWGCGLDCMSAAVIDGRSGRVLRLPGIPGAAPDGTFRLPTGSGDLRTLQFQTKSRLLGMPNIADGRVYFYTLQQATWHSLGSQPVQAAKQTP